MQKEVLLISSMESAPEINSADKDSVPDFIGDGDAVLDLSPIGLNDTEETSEPPWNEVPAKLVHVASNDSGQQQNARSSNEITDRVLRPHKNKSSLCVLDEAEDSEFSDKHPASSAADEGDNRDDEQFEQESEFKVKRKSTKTDEDKDKQSKKQNKAKNVKPKKFSHSTPPRRVDKALLEAPEDSIDYTGVPLRDLIRLAEHREKQANKEEATAEPAKVQSKRSSSAFHYENETYASREDEEDDNEQEPEAEVQDMNYLYEQNTHHEMV